MIRTATLHDRNDVLKLAREFCNFSNQPFDFEQEFFLENLSSAIEHPNHLVLLFFDGEVLCGILWGAVGSTLYSMNLVATELMWYVSPLHRGNIQSVLLVKRYEQWAKDMGCKMVTMSDIHNYNDLSDKYPKLGYKLKEKTYTKEV